MIRVILVDDHLIVRSGFAQLLSLEEDIQVVGQFSSVKEVMQKIHTIVADVCIADISMPDENGLDLLTLLPKHIHCIMLSVNDSALIIKKALELGAKGYLSKRCSPEELCQAVRTAYSGGCYLPPSLAMTLVVPKDNYNVEQLTKREWQICQLLAQGYEVKEVAEQLQLSFKTVHTHRANAMSKLNVKNNVELANFLYQHFNQ